MHPVEFFDTGGAAEWLAKEETSSVGVIASRACADIYRLRVLAEDIGDQTNNKTRFLVIVRDPSDIPSFTEDPKTTFVMFELTNCAGALIKCLRPFERHGINLSGLESLPHPDQPFVPVRFWMEVDSHPEHASMQKALKALTKTAQSIRILGHC